MARPRASISGRRLPLFFCRRELLFRAAESLIFWGPPTAVILSRPSVVIFFAADCPPRRWPLKFFSVDRRQSLASGRKPLFFPFRPPHPPLVPSAPLPPASSAPCPLCSLSVRLIRPLPPLLPFRPPLRSYPSPSGVSVFCSSLAQNGFPGLLFPNFGYGIMNCEFFFVTLHGYRHLFELW